MANGSDRPPSSSSDGCPTVDVGFREIRRSRDVLAVRCAPIRGEALDLPGWILFALRPPRKINEGRSRKNPGRKGHLHSRMHGPGPATPRGVDRRSSTLDTSGVRAFIARKTALASGASRTVLSTMRSFAFFLSLFALFALGTCIVSDAFPDSSTSLRKLLATEQVCKDNVNDFNPGKSRTLNSKKCRGDEILKRCRCKSPTNKIIGVANPVTSEGYCECTFTNESPNKRFDVFYEACALCEKNNDECQKNADCTEYEKPICDSDLSPKKCVQCKRNSQCSDGESCVSNKCVRN